MVKEKSVFSLFNFFRSFKGIEKDTNINWTILLFIGIILDIAIITAIRSYLDYTNLLSSSLQIIIGFPILWMFFYGIYYIFQSAFESKSKINFWKSYLQVGIPVLTGVLTIHFFNLLQYLSGNMYVNYFFALVNFLLIIYIFTMFIGNMKYYFNTTYPKVLASLILTYLVNLSLIELSTILTI